MIIKTCIEMWRCQGIRALTQQSRSRAYSWQNRADDLRRGSFVKSSALKLCLGIAVGGLASCAAVAYALEKYTKKKK